MYINLADLRFAIYSQGSWIAGSSAFTSRVLGLQACATLPGLCGAANRTHGFMLARKALGLLDCTHSNILIEIKAFTERLTEL